MNASPISSGGAPRVGCSLITGGPFVVENSSKIPTDTYLAGGIGLNMSIAGELQAKLAERIYTFDAETLRELDKVNQKLAQQGKPPVDIRAVTKEIEDIANNPNLSDKEKRKQINDIRKRLGLSKGEMKKLFTKRLEKIYDGMKKELQQTVDGLKAQVVQAERTYGKGSPQAVAAGRRLEAVAKVVEPMMQKLEQNRKLYNSMYKAGGCVKKMFKGIGGVFKGIATSVWNTVKTVINPKNWIRPSFWKNIVAPLAMNFIPGIGPIVSTAYRWGMAAYQGVKAVTALAKGRFLQAFSFASEALNGAANLGNNVISRGAAKAAQWVDKGLEYYQKGVEFYRDVVELPKTWIENARETFFRD
jgi:hypothetical protein